MNPEQPGAAQEPDVAAQIRDQPAALGDGGCTIAAGGGGGMLGGGGGDGVAAGVGEGEGGGV